MDMQNTILSTSVLSISVFIVECGIVAHSNLYSITSVATKVHVILRSYTTLIWMRDTSELVQHVTIWNETKCSILSGVVWCGPLCFAFPGDVADACTNIQQVA